MLNMRLVMPSSGLKFFFMLIFPWPLFHLCGKGFFIT